MKLPDDLKVPTGGDAIDRAAQDAVRLAHRVLERFPDAVRRHMVIAGGAAVSSALVALAGVAVARRMRRGLSADEAVEGVTEEEIVGLRVAFEETREVEIAVDAPTNGPGADGAGADGSGADGSRADGQQPLAVRQPEQDEAREARV